MGKIEIFKKGGFSERKGFKKFSDIIQIDSLNERTRNKIYTAFRETFDDIKNTYNPRQNYDFFVYYMFTEVFSKTEDDIPCDIYGYNYDKVLNIIKQIIIEDDYSEVFTLIECIYDAFSKINYYYPGSSKTMNQMFVEQIELVFKNENVNYKFLNGIITDIVSDEEIKSLDSSLSDGEDVTRSHMIKAINFLYKTKDYDNSIKESISAVESVCQIILDKDNVTLSNALKKLPKNTHPALIEAFKKIFAYTSDANGIRHANGLGEGNSTFEEARFMLISCSAFINYLRDSCKKH